MEEVREVKRSKRKESRFGKQYGFELKLRCVNAARRKIAGFFVE